MTLVLRWIMVAALVMVIVDVEAVQQSGTDDRPVPTSNLFIDVDPESARARPAVRRERRTLRKRSVRIDQRLLETARSDIRQGGGALPILRLNLMDDVVLTAVIEQTEPTSAGYALSGRIDGVPAGSVTLVVNGDIVAGTVRMPMATYTIRSTGDGRVAVRGVGPSPPLGDDVMLPLPTRGSHLERVDVPDGRVDDGSVIDVLVV